MCFVSILFHLFLNKGVLGCILMTRIFMSEALHTLVLQTRLIATFVSLLQMIRLTTHNYIYFNIFTGFTENSVYPDQMSTFKVF